MTLPSKRAFGWAGRTVAGLLIALMRLLPDSWHLPEKLAAGVVDTNRWSAGQRMMASYAPGAWELIARGAELETANRKALDACRKDAAKIEQSRRCTIKINPPTRVLDRKRTRGFKP